MTEFILNPVQQEKDKSKIEHQFNSYQNQSKKMQDIALHFEKQEDQFMNKIKRERSTSYTG